MKKYVVRLVSVITVSLLSLGDLGHATSPLFSRNERPFFPRAACLAPASSFPQNKWHAFEPIEHPFDQKRHPIRKNISSYRDPTDTLSEKHISEDYLSAWFVDNYTITHTQSRITPELETTMIPYTKETYQGYLHYPKNISIDGLAHRCIATDADGVLLWDMHNHQLTMHRNGWDYGYAVNALALNKEGTLCAFNPDPRWTGIVVYDLTTHMIRGWHPTEYITNLCFNETGTLLIGTTKTGLVKIWDLINDVVHTIKIDAIEITALCINQKGNRIILGDKRGHVHVLTIKDIQKPTLQTFDPIRGSMPVLSISISADGYRIAAGVADTTIRLFDLKKEKLFILTEREEDRQKVTSVVFHPRDHHILISGSFNTTITLWNLKKCLSKTLRSHTTPIHNLSISQDGKKLASIAGDGTIKVWNIDEPSIVQASEKVRKKRTAPHHRPGTSNEKMPVEKIPAGDTIMPRLIMAAA